MEQQKQLLEKLKEASSILIIANPDNQESILGACALACAYKKNIVFERSIVHENLKKVLKDKIPEQLWDGVTQRGQTTITIDVSCTPVKELRYEKNETSGTLHINIIPEKNSVTKEHINITHANPAWDIVLLVGIHDAKTLKRIVGTNEHPLITNMFAYVGVGTPQENFISLCSGCANEEEFVEIIYNLTSTTNDLDKLCLTLLFALTKKIIDNPQHISPKPLSLAATLLEKGANKQLALELLNTTKPLDRKDEFDWNQPQSNEVEGISFVTLPINNQYDATRVSSLVSSLLAKESIKGLVMFFKKNDPEAPRVFECLFTHKDLSIQKEISKLLGAHEQNNVAFFHMHAQNQPQAQQKIAKLIKTTSEHIYRAI